MKPIILSLIAGVVLCGCSSISDDERYIAVESVAAQRVVLVEDFTGQNCINCPKAHETLAGLTSQYKDAVIAVSIHAGGFAIPATYTRYTGLMQPEGQEYNDAYGIDEWPKGVVNGNGTILNYQEWPEAVRNAVQVPTPLRITLDAACAGGEGDIAINVTLSSSEALTGDLRVWVIEDGIVARQRDIDRGLITDYVHDHVFRAAVNGTWGQPVTLQPAIHKTLTFSQPLRATDTETWVPARLSIVAFVTDADGVVQAAITPVNCE